MKTSFKISGQECLHLLFPAASPVKISLERIETERLVRSLK